MSAVPKVLDLGALADAARQPKVALGGTAYAVHPLTAADAHRIAVAVERGVNSEIVEAMTAAARRGVPDMPDDLFARLTVEQVAAVVSIARSGADAVEALLAEQAKAEGGGGNP